MEVKPNETGADSGNFEAIRQYPEQSRFKVIFVKAGYAKVGEFTLGPKWKYEERATNTASELASLGLHTDVSVNSRGYMVVNYSASKEDLESFLKPGDDSDKNMHHRNVASYFGTPETAVEGYVNDTYITDAETPDDIKNHPLFEIIHFAMSKAHFRKEWNEYLKKANAAAKKFPDLVEDFGLSDFFKEI